MIKFINLFIKLCCSLSFQNYPNLDDHVLQISADKYTPNKEDDIYIPTGNLQVVKQLNSCDVISQVYFS